MPKIELDDWICVLWKKETNGVTLSLLIYGIFKDNQRIPGVTWRIFHSFLLFLLRKLDNF